MRTLRSKEVTSWLRSRYARRSKEEYLLSEAELARLEDIKQIFQDFDRDNSGTLDLNELAMMLKTYGLIVTKPQLKNLFSVVNPRNRHYLTFDEFRRFAMGTEGAESTFQLEFKRLSELLKEQHPNTKFMPGDINAMIRHLLLLKKSTLFMSRIGTVLVQQTSINVDLAIFKGIFSLRHSVGDISSHTKQQGGAGGNKTHEIENTNYEKKLRRKIDLAKKR